MIAGELKLQRIYYSGGHNETRELSTHKKYEFNVHSELDIKAEEFYAEGMENSNDENTGGTQIDSGEDIFLNKKLVRIWNRYSLRAKTTSTCLHSALRATGIIH